MIWLGALQEQLRGGAIAPPLELRPLAVTLMEPGLRQPGVPRRQRLLLERLVHHGNQSSRLAQLLGPLPAPPDGMSRQLLALAAQGQQRLQGRVVPRPPRPVGEARDSRDLIRLALEDELQRLGDVARLLVRPVGAAP